MKSNIETIDPTRAKELLQAVDEDQQRRLSAATVERYALDMAAGLWAENGDSIRISKAGNLLDGRHRLTAIVKAGISLRILVVTDIEASCLRTIDRGKRRSMRDMFRCAGWEGRYASCGELARLQLLLNNGNRSITDGNILECAESHRESFKWVSEAFGSHVRALARAPVRLAVAELYERNPGKAREMATRLHDGEGLTAGSPILALRNYLVFHHGVKELVEITYRKSVAACLALIEHRTITKLYQREWPK